MQAGKKIRKWRIGIIILLLCMAGIMSGKISGGKVLAAQTSGDYEYTVDNLQVTITKYTGSATSVTIPSSLGGNEVVAIGANAFQNTAVQSVKIPDTVVSIGNYAFQGCSALVNLTLPSNLERI
ncbi:MAG: leucine-rich repeat domain-containing protein, partial [Clostridium sp.]|nr:leucine-rich repeat domain-containing protein [Clostridium sp.]